MARATIRILQALRGVQAAMVRSVIQAAGQDEVWAVRRRQGLLGLRTAAVLHTFPTTMGGEEDLVEDHPTDLARLMALLATTAHRRVEAAGGRLGARHLLEAHQEDSIHSSIKAWVPVSIPTADV